MLQIRLWALSILCLEYFTWSEHPLGLTMLLYIKTFPLSGIYSIPLNVRDTLLLPILLLAIIKVGSYPV